MPDVESMYHVYIRKHDVAEFVKLANQLHCAIELAHTNTNSPIVVSGKSLMGMLEICLRGMLLLRFPNGYTEEDRPVVEQILGKWAIISIKGEEQVVDNREGDCD